MTNASGWSQEEEKLGQRNKEGEYDWKGEGFQCRRALLRVLRAWNRQHLKLSNQHACPRKLLSNSLSIISYIQPCPQGLFFATSSLFSSFQSWYLTSCLWSTCRNQKPFLLLCGAEAFKLEHELESESLEGLAKTQIPGNPPQGSWSVGLGLGLRICISDEFPGDADVVGLRTKFGYHWCGAICLFTAPSSLIVWPPLLQRIIHSITDIWHILSLLIYKMQINNGI